MLVLGTGGAGGGDLVVCEATRDDDTTLVDCLERVSCEKVSALIIIIVCIHVCLLFIRLYTWQNLRVCSKSRALQNWKRLMPYYERSLMMCASRPSRYVSVINANHLVSLINFNVAKVD
jgi:hypothetical protein